MATPSLSPQRCQRPLGVLDHNRRAANRLLAGQVRAGARQQGLFDEVVAVAFGHDRHEQGASTDGARVDGHAVADDVGSGWLIGHERAGRDFCDLGHGEPHRASLAPVTPFAGDSAPKPLGSGPTRSDTGWPDRSTGDRYSRRVQEQVRLVVLFGGQSAEHDVSCVTARHVLAAASPERYSIDAIGIGRDGEWVRTDAVAALHGSAGELPDALAVSGDRVDPSLVTADTDLPVVVLPLLHGPMGEDGTVQGMLDLADVPYVGTGVLGSALCMDKAMAKQAAASFGIPQAAWRTLHVDDLVSLDHDALLRELGPVVFVKPANMGSSVGVSRADSVAGLRDALDAAATYDEWMVVEENVVGREIEIGVLGNRRLEASVAGEIVPGDDFYSYEDKYHDGVAETLVPADISPAQSDEVRALACRAGEALRVQGLARVDFFLEEQRGFLLNEINTMPGFTPISMFPKLWEATGVSYPQLIDRLVDLALERHTTRTAHRSTGR